MTQPRPGLPTRYRLLDGFRAVASLSVVVWHYQHLFYDPVTRQVQLDIATQPFFSVLSPLYRHGALAVDFFFVLSGFIFFAFYSERLMARDVGVREFAVLRFSRLYPLHLVTWIAVGLLQALYALKHGAAFVFQHNSTMAGLLGLFFVVGWGPFEGAFNAPAWSISVEVLLYVIFFLMCRFQMVRPRPTVLVAAAAYLMAFAFPKVGGAFSNFLVGGVCFFLANRLAGASPTARRAGAVVIAALLVSAIFGLSRDLDSSPTSFLSGVAQSLNELTGRAGLFTAAKLFNRLSTALLQLALFPGLVLLGALGEAWIANRRLSWLTHFGDTTYAVYLVHFPLQLCCVLALGVYPQLYASPYFFIAFFSGLLVLGSLVFRNFERPAQRRLRELLLVPQRPMPK